MQTWVWNLEIYEPAVKISLKQWGLFSLDARDSLQHPTKAEVILLREEVEGAKETR